MTIDLYTNTSPSNYVNKVLNPLVTMDGTLKNSTNVIDPVILIENMNWEYMNTITNYAKILEFGRYYYITNIQQVNNRLWEFAMHVDVLMSYRSTLLQQTAIVARQENIFNMDLDDGWFMAYQKMNHKIQKFSVANPFDHQEYVLVVAGS